MNNDSEKAKKKKAKLKKAKKDKTKTNNNPERAKDYKRVGFYISENLKKKIPVYAYWYRAKSESAVVERALKLLFKDKDLMNQPIPEEEI